MRKATLNPPTHFDSLQYGFSQGVIVQGGKRLLLSGQVGVDAEERLLCGTMAGQAHASLDNIERLLHEAGGELAHVVMLRIYIAAAGRNEQDAIAATLKARFPHDPPASSWVVVEGLSLPEWLIEIEAEAVLPDS